MSLQEMKDDTTRQAALDESTSVIQEHKEMIPVEDLSEVSHDSPMTTTATPFKAIPTPTAKTNKRYSFSLNGFRKSSTSSINTTTTSSSRKGTISISGPSPLISSPNDSSSSLGKLDQPLMNSVYGTQTYSEQKKQSYSLCQSLTSSLKQAAVKVECDATDSTGLEIPTLVMRCCQYIQTNDPAEGIFRVNSSLKKIKTLEAMINDKLETDKDFSFEELYQTRSEEIGEEINVCDAAVILKRFLNNMTEFLIDHDQYHKFNKNHASLNHESSTTNMAAYSTSEVASYQTHAIQKTITNNSSSAESAISKITTRSAGNDAPPSTSPSTTNTELSNDQKQLLGTAASDDRLSTALKSDSRDLVKNIPKDRLDLLIYLLQFLHALTRSESIVAVTKMSPLNLAKIFQPSLFEFKVEKQSSTENLLDFYKNNELILCRWIEHFDLLSTFLSEDINTKPESMANISPTMNTTVLSRVQTAEPVACLTLSNDSLSHESEKKATELDIKKLRRRSLFGYRSLSASATGSASSSIPNSASTFFNNIMTKQFSHQPQQQHHQTHQAFTTTDTNNNSNTTTKSKLKRLPTTIFGSSYSLKTKLQPTLQDQQQSAISPAAISRPRKRLTIHGLDQLIGNKQQGQEQEQQPEPQSEPQSQPQEQSHFNSVKSTMSAGLQTKPLFSHSLEFNSPRTSPIVEQLDTFENTVRVIRTEDQFHSRPKFKQFFHGSIRSTH